MDTFPIADNDRKTPLGSYPITRRDPVAFSAAGAELAHFLGFYRRPGHTAWIGLHAVPLRGTKYDSRIKTLGEVGTKPTPGCIYASPADALTAWRFTRSPTKVVVVP